MTQKERTDKIKKISNNDSLKIASKEIYFRNELKPYSVYQIPLNCLVYNKYNGRINSRVRTHEKIRKKIDPETPEGKKIIEDYIYSMDEKSSKKTLNDLKKKSQIEPGIITSDGIIVDGNRRASLLHKLKQNYFKAIILPVEFTDDPVEIQKLEIMYQEGADEKVGYQAIEKYIQTNEFMTNSKKHNKDLKDDDIINELSKLRNQPKSKIRELIETFSIMEEYLKFHKYTGFYTQLETREDLFLRLREVWNKFFEKESADGFEGYKKIDVTDLKTVHFDYIRYQMEGKRYRTIAKNSKKNIFFGDKSIWNSFYNQHIKNNRTLRDLEINIDKNELDEALLEMRDIEFKKNAKKAYEENFEIHEEKLLRNKHFNTPSKKITEAKHLLEENIKKALTTGKDSLPDIKEIKEIVNKAENKISSIDKLKLILSDLKKITTEDIPEKQKDSFKTVIDQVQKQIYHIKKSL